MCSAPGVGSGRGFEPVAITMCLAWSIRSPTRIVSGPANVAWPSITSTPRFAIARARLAGISLIMAFSRSIKLAQSRRGLPTEMLWTAARSISCKACPAATRIFFGAQPRFGQVPPIPRFDHRNGHAGAPHRTGHADAGVASTEDHHIEFLSRHNPTSFAARDDVSRA